MDEKVECKGYFYSSYVPMAPTMTPVVLDPNDFRPRKDIITRYDRKEILEKGDYTTLSWDAVEKDSVFKGLMESWEEFNV